MQHSPSSRSFTAHAFFHGLFICTVQHALKFRSTCVSASFVKHRRQVHYKDSHAPYNSYSCLSVCHKIITQPIGRKSRLAVLVDHFLAEKNAYPLVYEDLALLPLSCAIPPCYFHLEPTVLKNGRIFPLLRTTSHWIGSAMYSFEPSLLHRFPRMPNWCRPKRD